mmetsp:Transcript_31239/g.64749  ORF Transcript_31239/g.64749 Transcript_31239/m.64749 type:complete len:378 (+) Transcript_31239:131-1264(+)
MARSSTKVLRKFCILLSCAISLSVQAQAVNLPQPNDHAQLLTPATARNDFPELALEHDDPSAWAVESVHKPPPPAPSNFSTPTPTALCMSPPCPEAGGLSLKPLGGPNNNQQLGTAVVTISGSLFPADCSPACFMTPPCEVCEMEVTYFVYFGTTEAGCNFYDTAAAACQCNPISGQDLVRKCDWEGVSFASKYRCNELVCQVSPLYGQQPLKIFFKEKSCVGKHCAIFPAIDGHIDPEAQLWALNFTYEDPKISHVIPPTLPSSGGHVTIVGESFGGDSNYIQVKIDGKAQGVPSNPKIAKGTQELAMVVEVYPHDIGEGVLEVYVGQPNSGAPSQPFIIQFKDLSHRMQLLTAIAVVGMVLGILLLLLLAADCWA